MILVKKLIILSQSEIDYVKNIAKTVSDPRSKNGNFSKGIRKIIEEHLERMNAKNKGEN